MKEVSIFIIGIAIIIIYNLSQINPNQNLVNTEKGDYWRTNPNSTISDNIGTNEGDIWNGIFWLAIGGIIFYVYALPKLREKGILENKKVKELMRELIEYKIPRPIRFLLGIVALFMFIRLAMPFLQGWFFLMLALCLIYPEKWKILTEKVKKKAHEIMKTITVHHNKNLEKQREKIKKIYKKLKWWMKYMFFINILAILIAIMPKAIIDNLIDLLNDRYLLIIFFYAIVYVLIVIAWFFSYLIFPYYLIRIFFIKSNPSIRRECHSYEGEKSWKIFTSWIVAVQIFILLSLSFSVVKFLEV